MDDRRSGIERTDPSGAACGVNLILQSRLYRVSTLESVSGKSKVIGTNKLSSAEHSLASY